MKKFFRTQYGALQMEAIFFNWKTNYIDEPKFLISLAPTNNPNAKMSELAKGQYDWNSRIIFMLNHDEVITIYNLFRTITKNFKLPFKSNKNIWDHIPEKGISKGILHKKNEKTYSSLMLNFKVGEFYDKSTKSNKYTIELHINMVVKENGNVKVVKGKDQSGKTIDREQKYYIKLNSAQTNDLESFFFYIKSFIENGLLYSDILKNIGMLTGYQPEENKNNYNNKKQTKQSKPKETKKEEKISEEDYIDDIDDIEF